MTGPSPLLPWALAYAAVGYVVLPLKRGTNVPHGGLLGRGWSFCEHTRSDPTAPLVGSTDPAVITQWWTLDPAANIGIATGCRSRLLVVDIDRKGAADRTGYDSWREWIYGETPGPEALPPHPRVASPSGGLHRWFGLPEGAHAPTKIHWLRHVDAKGCGGFVAVPPSGRRIGVDDAGEDLYGEYAFDDDPVPPVPVAPQWLVDDMSTRQPDPPPRPPGAGLSGAPWPAGGPLPPTTEFLARGFGWFSGSRDRDCYRLAWRLWELHRDERAVTVVVRHCWERTDQALNGHGFPWSQAQKTIASAGERWRSRSSEESRIVANLAGESGGRI